MDFASLFFIHNYHGYILQIFIAEMLFLPLLRRRSRFLLRLLIAFLPFALLSIVLTNLLAMRVNGLASITIFLLSLGLQIAIYESKVKDILFCCVGAMLIQNLSHNIEQLFYLPFKENFNNIGWFFLSVGVMVAVYALAYILIVYPQPKGSEINITSRSTLIIAASSALFCYLIHTLFALHGLSDHWISALPFILVDLLALALSFGLVSYRNKKEENQELERSIAKVHHYYAFMRNNIDILKDRLTLRQSEISNSPEVIRRLGVIAINTAIEVDIYGNANSTHISGTKMMNGIGGSGDFERNAYISIFTCSSVAKDGIISSIVPFVSHQDHSEHDVNVIVTEQGVADLRGKSPLERANLIIENCAHPDYKPLLRDYLKLATGGHTHHNLPCAFAFHDTLRRKGDMRLTDFAEYVKD